MSWFEDHQGELLRTEGRVWYCDDDCKCEQAQIVNVYRNKVTGNSVVRELVWEGDYHTDPVGWGDGCVLRAEEELAAHRDALRLSDPELESRIQWA